MTEALNDTEVMNKLNQVLERKETTINISLDEGNVIKVEEKKMEVTDEKKVLKTDEKRTVSISKILKSVYKVFESFFDSIVKSFLKKKYKINNSVYNDGKKAVIALTEKDTKTFLKKATDSVLNLLKKLPVSTRKIIKDTKNVAIDEIYSWKVE